MNFDRGFIKWQPFNSVATPTTLLKNNEKKVTQSKPLLFPEELEKINLEINEAYYNKSQIKIYFYEQNSIKMIETSIIKLIPNMNTIEISNHKIIHFNQIIKIIS